MTNTNEMFLKTKLSWPAEL